MSAIEEGWTEDVLLKLTPFTVDFPATTTIAKTSKNGGKYEQRVVVVSCASYANRFAVEVSRKAYQALRLLNLAGVKKFSASEGIADTRGYRPIYYAGAKGLDAV